MIDKRTVTAATCDACGTTRYSETSHVPGYAVTITEYDRNGVEYSTVDFYVCRLPHIGKAAKAVFATLVDGPDSHDTEPATEPARQPTLAGV